MNFVQYTKFGLISLVLGVSTTLLPITAVAAERITFNLPPFGQFYIQVEDLETFITTGEVSFELAYYLNRLPPEQVARLPELLSTPLEIHPLSIAKFSNSTIGETVIKNFGKAIRSDIDLNGFLALRGAIIAAAFDSEGLTVLNLLDKFPLETIYVDLDVLNQYVALGEKILLDREAIEQLFLVENEDIEQNITELFKQQEDLQIQGKYTWRVETFNYNNPRRLKTGYFDLYQPRFKKNAPLIVISHGLASNRQTFAYLAKHLASHGFAVAVIEHDEISLNKFDGFLSGSEQFPEANNLIDQPLDVKYVLDQLEQETQVNLQLKNKIDLQQVGIIGQSFGAYTALALGGAQIDDEQIAGECDQNSYRDVLLDFSSLAKCTFIGLAEPIYHFKDDRIKAVLAINPLGKIFDSEGMGQINVPTMLISGTHDLITPPVAEQIEPFSWLDNKLDKYLVLVKPATHFSFLQEGLGVLPVPDRVVGPSPTSAYAPLKALSTAFFRGHLEQRRKYQNYLQSDRLCQCNKSDRSTKSVSSDRLNILSNDEFELIILRSLTNNELQELINN